MTMNLAHLTFILTIFSLFKSILLASLKKDWLSPSVLSQIASINEDIIKPPTDKNQYRALILKNGMKVLLVSDRNATMAGSSLSVNTGYMNDPKEYQGLAHFLEHMLFLGSKKYPTENDLQKFVETYKGGRNAYTSSDRTVYFFIVLSNQLFEAFDRFVQFFISPLLTENATQREIMTIESEFNFRFKDDRYRKTTVLKSLINETHDFGQFSCGNAYSLMDDPKSKKSSLREALVTFYETYYSSNVMEAVIVGNYSLDELTEAVVPLLGQIANKNIKAPTWPTNPFGPDQLGYQINIVPLSHKNELSLIFPVPDHVPEYYLALIPNYMEKILEYEGPDSMLRELKSRHWAEKLKAFFAYGFVGFRIFEIKIDLTEKGQNHLHEIIIIVFSYLNMLKEKGTQEWLFRELEKQWSIDFKFKDQPKLSNLLDLIGNFKFYQPNNWVDAYPEYKPELIRKFLTHLDVDNFNVIFISETLKNKTNLKEKWTSAEYSLEKIDKNLFDKFKNGMKDLKFDLPQPNKFIPSNLDLFKSDNNGTPSQFPQIIHQNNISRIWYKQDTSFQIPKAKIFLKFYNPEVSSSPSQVNFLLLLNFFLMDKMPLYLHDIKDSGIETRFHISETGFTMSFEGFNDKMGEAIIKCLTILLNEKIEQENFIELKNLVTRRLKNYEESNLVDILKNYFDVLQKLFEWPVNVHIEELESTSLEDFIAFRRDFFSNLFIVMFAYGNVNNNVTMNIYQQVLSTLNDKKIKIKPFFDVELNRQRLHRLPDGSSFVFEKETKIHDESAIYVVFPTKAEDDHTEAISQILQSLIHATCYDELRTKEQLGYGAYCGTNSILGVNRIFFIVKGHYSPAYVDQRIEALIINLEKYLNETNATKFESVKSSLIKTLLEKDKSIFEAANQFWNEISGETYHFEKKQALVENIKNITISDVASYFKKYIAMDSPFRKKLSIYVKSTTDKGHLNDSKKDASFKKDLKAKKINNLVEFKKSLPLYGLPQSHLNIKSVGINSLKQSQS